MQLHAATARGEVDAMALALKCGADANARNGIGQTPLMYALDQAKGFQQRNGPVVTIAAVRFLLEAGADLEVTDDLGATAIHHAAKIADAAFLEVILEYGGNPKHISTHNYSVLTHACYQPSSPQKRAIIKRLCELGAPLNFSTDYGEFPLGVCLYFGDFDSLRLLVEVGANTDPLNWTPLHRAVAFGEISALEALTPTSMEINRVNHRFQLSPWRLAMIRGDPGIVQWLAKQGADLTQLGRNNRTLYHIAARFGHLPILRWLHELGGHPNAVDDDKVSPLHEASTWNHTECASALIEFGPYVHRRNNVKSQPINAARSMEMIRILVKDGGADPNWIDGCGDWPLKTAAEDNDVHRIQWLLENGAKVDQTSTGETALHAAVRRDSREAIDLLLAAGANPNQQDVDGWTPLFEAQSVEAIRTLLKAGADRKIQDQAGSIAESWVEDPILSRALK